METIKPLTETILSAFNNKYYTICSWGIKNIKEIKDGISFDVNGFIYTGRVEVIYKPCPDLFEIWEVNGDSRTKMKERVYIFQLVDEIDRLVEKDCSDEEYDQKVNEFYKVACYF